MKFCLKSALAACGAFVALAGPASAGVIFFDSFEQPQVRDWAVFQVAGDNGDWVANFGAGIELQNESLGITDAYDGEQYVELDSDTSRGGLPAGTNTGMVALVDFVAGQAYEISFAYKPRTNTPDDNIIDLFALSYNSGIVTDSAFLLSANETTSTLSGWLIYTVIYVAQEGFNAIGIRAEGIQNSLGGFVDAVSVSQVPIPAALPLFAAGLAGFGAVARRKRKAA